MLQKDPIVEKVIDKYIMRSNTGMVKYGTTLEENPLDVIEWLIHLQEELMDATLYLERMKSEIIKEKVNTNRNYS